MHHAPPASNPAHIHGMVTPPPAPATDAHKQTDVSRLLTRIAIGGAIIGGAIILAPHILPALGIGSADMAAESVFVLHNSADIGGSGLAGILSTAVSAVPVIGDKLAAGGLFSAVATGVIGIGGVLLGNAISKNEDGSAQIHWGKIIKYAALATSAVIALPTLLTSLSAGLIFLGSLFSSAAAPGIVKGVVSFVDSTIGTMGGSESMLAMMGVGGLTAAIPHLFTCGMPFVPAALNAKLEKSNHQHAAQSAELQSHVGYGMQVQLDAPIIPGIACEGTIRLRHNDDGRPLSVSELARVHTEKLHVFLVGSNMDDYHHIHPRPTAQPGEFRFIFTPTQRTNYNLWADITTAHDMRNHVLKETLRAPQALPSSPRVVHSTISHKGAYAFDWVAKPPLEQGRESIVEIMVRDARGKLVQDLSPVLGAFAHLVGFSADGKDFVHCHPVGHEPQSDSERAPGVLRFALTPPCCGAMRFFLQVNHQGQDVVTEFGQQVRSATMHTEAEVARAAQRGHNSHGGHAFAH
jgi:hypothetical protein